MCSDICVGLGGTVVGAGVGTRRDCCNPGRVDPTG